VLGAYDVYQGSANAALRHGVQAPLNDPLALVPLMAQATSHLGFGVTAAVTYEHPYTFARRMSTLDHLTRGRIGWNIVTGYLDSAARNLGLEQQLGHDERYDLADEYLDVVYKLWEKSWEDDAVSTTRTRGVYADPAKVHPINHAGRHYKVPGFHLCEPSPQRTPLLYQAGTSPRGTRFAARHAECTFVSGPSKQVVKKLCRRSRAAVRAAGRDGDELKVYAQALIITAPTEAEARAKLRDYRSHIDIEAALVPCYPAGPASTSAGSTSTPPSNTSTPTPAARRWPRFSQADPTNGPCAKLRNSSAWADAGRCWSAIRRRWPTNWKPGRTKPASTASTWPSRCATWSRSMRDASSNWSCRNCSGAGKGKRYRGWRGESQHGRAHTTARRSAARGKSSTYLYLAVLKPIATSAGESLCYSKNKVKMNICTFRRAR
jgi:alkanesulfonate monooxygenase SsuD/methylene tetrahydromethanopterin reductase-like flavin-dependent oxidoreductase (luciferase family)